MSFRLNEGCGECIYILGVGDNGELNGITEYDYKLKDFIKKLTSFMFPKS